MKFIKYCLLAILTGSCTSNLEYINYGDINPSVFPKTASDAQSLVNACYTIFRTNYSNCIHSSGQGIVFIDNTTEVLRWGNYTSEPDFAEHNFSPSNQDVTGFYDIFYNKISLITLTIDQIQHMDLNEEQKKKFIAELRCLRGYLSYVLFDLYGPIVVAPIEVLKDPLIEEPLGRLPYHEMVAFIEEDLRAASTELAGPSESEYGRVNSALARMILIRLYLHEKKWNDVVKVADEIISMGHYSIDKDYVAMWGLEGAKQSNEVIWAIPCDYEGQNSNEWHYSAVPWNYPGFSGFGSASSTWWFYDTFEQADVRKTNLIAEYVGIDGVLYSRENPGQTLISGPRPIKMDLDVGRPGGSSTVDWILYRYADVLLSKAEGIANSLGAPNEEAIELVNVIRRRAGLKDVKLSDYSTLPLFNDMLLTERSHEFWAENGQYRADLIRHDKFVSRSKEVTGSIYTDKTKELFPFSNARISEGKGKFLQNPGYN